MTLRDFLVGLAASLTTVVVVGYFKGETAALICLGITLALLAVVQLFFYSRGLIIHYAGYGIGDEQYEDVTLTLRGYIRNDKLNVVINYGTFNCDPYKDIKKHVFVRYSYRDRSIKEKIRHEGDRLILP